MTNDEAVKYMENHEFIIPVSVSFLGGSVSISTAFSGRGHSEGRSFAEAVESFAKKVKERTI